MNLGSSNIIVDECGNQTKSCNSVV